VPAGLAILPRPLIGVREVAGRNGKQKGEPVGHPIDDDSRLQMMGKALSCSPPIQVEIFVENLLPFFSAPAGKGRMNGGGREAVEPSS
jgi:hypothetical protein